MIIDLRSDTVTKPTPDMLNCMMNAPVGDDVFGEDPTVNQLETYAADLFGKEAALFCTSGTLTNQIAIKLHTQPGDEVICDIRSHIYQYEAGGIAFNSGCSVKLIHSADGLLNSQLIKEAINPNDIHKAPSKLVSLENTCNIGGGNCYNWNDLQAIAALCKDYQLKLHLDGARIFNAIIKMGYSALQIGSLFDTVSICLSKGLGAPVGSMLLGSATDIRKARRIRKILGGGMRQAGYLAAAGLFALQNNIPNLEKDHQHAQQIANTLKNCVFVNALLPVETNIIIFEVNQSYNPKEIVSKLAKNNILVMNMGYNRIRMVLHSNIDASMINNIVTTLKALY